MLPGSRRLLSTRRLAPAPVLWSSSASAARSVHRRGLSSVYSRGADAAAFARAYWPWLAAGTGGLVAIYGLGSGMYHLTSTVLSLDLKQAFAIGLGTGVVSIAALSIAASVASRRFVTINVSAVQRRALAELARSATASAELGANIRAGAVRAYNTTGPRARRAPAGMGLTLLEPRARMLLQVEGDDGAGIATVEAVNHRGSTQLTLLALDMPASSARGPSLHILVGTEEKLHVQGGLRAFLQAERARFIPQDVPLTEEALLQEQDALPPEEEEPGSDAQGKPRTGAE